MLYSRYCNWGHYGSKERQLAFVAIVLLIAALITTVPMPSTPNNLPAAVQVPPSHPNDGSTPRILHFVFLSPGLPEKQPEIPVDVSDMIQKWKVINPYWEVILWNNTLVRKHFPDTYELVKPISQMAWVADLVRYQAIYKYGGFYFDTDILPFRSIERLRSFAPFAVCEGPYLRHFGTNDTTNDKDLAMKINECTRACNAVIAFPANHAAIKAVASRSMNNSISILARNSKNPQFELEISGPPMFTDIIRKYPDVTFLKSFTFYPCHYEDKELCKANLYQNDSRIFGMHLWKKSWR